MFEPIVDPVRRRLLRFAVSVSVPVSESGAKPVLVTPRLLLASVVGLGNLGGLSELIGVASFDVSPSLDVLLFRLAFIVLPMFLLLFSVDCIESPDGDVSLMGGKRFCAIFELSASSQLSWISISNSGAVNYYRE